MKKTVALRAASLLTGLALLLSMAVFAAPTASAASPAATAFSKCMDGYLAAQQYAYKWHQDRAGLAILYTGYTNCYAALSMRNDIREQTQLDAVAQAKIYQARAAQAITVAVLAQYQSILRKYALKGIQGMRL